METFKIICIVLLIYSLPALIEMLIAFIYAVFFYGDSETDKMQIEYLIEKEKRRNKSNG